MSDSADRERIAALIRALRSKAVENGCTEGEAMSAAAKLSELLGAYNMTLDEADLRASPFAQHREAHDDHVGKRLWMVVGAIEELTGAKGWTSRPSQRPFEFYFFGFAHEVDVARYLFEMCARAMRTAGDELIRTERLGRLRPAAMRNRLNPFLDGMAERLHERLSAMIPPKPAGTGLVVIRGDLIKAAMADAGIELGATERLGANRRDPAYAEGRRHAETVSLVPGLAASQARGAIGSR